MDDECFGYYGVFRGLNKYKLKYDHKDQLKAYESFEPDVPSEHFRQRYRFHEDTVKALAVLFQHDLEPKSTTNNAFTAVQKICLALRFFGTGSFQKVIGDSEGASQATIHNHVMTVAKAFSRKCNDFCVFSLNEGILDQTATGFYGFSGSKMRFIVLLNCNAQWLYASQVNIYIFSLQSFLM